MERRAHLWQGPGHRRVAARRAGSGREARAGARADRVLGAGRALAVGSESPSEVREAGTPAAAGARAET